MSTKDQKVHIIDKKFMTTDDFGPHFLGFLEKSSKDNLKLIYPRQGFFTGGVLSSVFEGTITISTPILATDGKGNILSLDPNHAVNIPFENQINTTYYVGLRYVALFRDTELNPRTGQVEYRLIEESIGEIAEPDVITDQGTTLKITINSVTEKHVNHLGRTVRVFLKRAMGQADAFFDGLVQFDGTDNYIETTSLLGQATGFVETDPSKYQAFLIGPTIKKNTDLSLDPDVAFLGTVVGVGNLNIPSVFDQTLQVQLSQLVPRPGEGFLAQILTLLESGGTLSHDVNHLGRIQSTLR